MPPYPPAHAFSPSPPPPYTHQAPAGRALSPEAARDARALREVWSLAAAAAASDIRPAIGRGMGKPSRGCRTSNGNENGIQCILIEFRI